MKIGNRVVWEPSTSYSATGEERQLSIFLYHSLGNLSSISIHSSHWYLLDLFFFPFSFVSCKGRTEFCPYPLVTLNVTALTFSQPDELFMVFCFSLTIWFLSPFFHWKLYLKVSRMVAERNWHESFHLSMKTKLQVVVESHGAVRPNGQIDSVPFILCLRGLSCHTD